MVARVGSLNQGNHVAAQARSSPTPTRICHHIGHANLVPKCQEGRAASAFNREGRKYSGLHGICREAQRRARQTAEGKAATARRNKRRWALAEYRVWALDYQRKRRRVLGATYDLKRSRARLQTLVMAWKKQGCADCGYDDIRAIEPDHMDDAVKVGNLSRMVQMCASEGRIRAELDKCVPRCVRCHCRGDSATTAMCMAKCGTVAPIVAAASGDAGPKRPAEDDLRLHRLPLARMATRARLGSCRGRQSCRHLADDCERPPVVGDRGRDGQVRARLCQLSSNPDVRKKSRDQLDVMPSRPSQAMVAVESGAN